MIDGKTVVGIVPWCNLWQSENQYEDTYILVETYGRRVLDSGMIPLAVLPVDGMIRTPVLELCDAFVITGGSGTGPYHMQVIDYALKTGKKVLGICLGCQALQKYFVTKNEMEEKAINEEIGAYFKKKMERKETKACLQALEGHRYPLLPRGDKSGVKHPVILEPDSHVAQILGTTRIMGATFHSFCIADPAPQLKVTARAEDGVIEGVEYGDNVIGVQFHPDVDNELQALFDFLKN